ncbi:MAG: ATP-dependent Clp protease adaptor ClpS [Micavibrio sp.]|nr:ATP-dependent Clp protease adaptor ClpS [Micavibrio sp.]
METEVLIKQNVKQKAQENKSIIVYNDDFNTFNWVIECLMKYCGHTPEQAEQCTMLVHYKGRCSVKGGSFDKLKPIHEALLENGLTSKIE